MRIHEPVIGVASRAPQSIAIFDSGRAITYAELTDTADRIATRLLREGVGTGDRVVTVVPNSVFPIALCLAASRLGASVVPLNPKSTATEAQTMRAFVSAAVLIIDRELRAWTEGDAGASLDPHDLIATEPDRRALDLVESSEDCPAYMFLTSGSTGSPKAIIAAHSNILANTTSYAFAADITSADRTVMALPISHGSAIATIFTYLVRGGAVAVERSFDAGRVADLIRDIGVSVLLLVPTALSKLLDELESRARDEVATLRLLQTGGAMGGEVQLKRAAELLPWIAVAQTYGQTEAVGFVTGHFHAPGEPFDASWSSCGWPMYSTRVALRTEHGTPAAVGEVGEILVAGPSVCEGYFENPDETAATFVDGWLITGDLGVVDDHGRLSIVGRRKEIIITGGENVFPTEVEALVATHSAVQEVAVAGTSDPYWGEVVTAYVILAPGASLTLDELRAHCKDLGPDYLNPQRLEILQDFPRTETGKVQRRLLRPLSAGSR